MSGDTRRRRKNEPGTPPRRPGAMLGSTLSLSLLLILAASGALANDAEPPAPDEVARAVDELIEKETREGAPELPSLVSDEDFLRRASLAIAGRPPAPGEITAFVLDPSGSKRFEAIDRLVASDAYPRNQARYWRESILARAQDRRARGVAGLLEDWLAERFAADRPWDETVSALLTATGSVSEEGSTGLIVAQMADPVALASESARLFLGIQIQCAQCHDHPYDRWKREQFHELAAFFPRVRIQRRDSDGKPDFEVVSTDAAGAGRNGAGPFADPERFLERRDADGDGKLVLREVPEPARRLFRRALQRLDRDGDRALDLQELRGIRKLIARRGRGRAEHFMPDLDDPQSRGTLMQPVFFIGGGSPGEGAPDRERRETLARYLTGPENPWFARAFVNRVWFEMLGRGFYEPIDDVGPDRKVVLEEALDLLARGFTENGYRASWLVRTIGRTRAFQRAGRERSETEAPPFAAVCMARLGAEQIYESLANALGIDPGSGSTDRRPAFRGRRGGGLRAQFAALFGHDPSTPPEDVAGTIPQALFLMNAPLIARSISARGGVLAGLLREIEEDEDLVLELYLRTLAREPSPEELATCLGHVEATGSREEAFEDIFWCLLNSTEFLTRK